MADNVTITEGANATPVAGTIIATDEVSSRHFQIVKLALGADGTASLVVFGQALKAASLPVTLASDQDDVKVTLDGETVGLSGNLPDTASGDLAAIKTAAQLLDDFISGSRGLVTEDNSAAIKTAVEALAAIISGSELQVDVISLAGLTALGQALKAASLPVTLASDQDDIAVTLDGEAVGLSGDLPDTTAGDLAAIRAAIEIIDNAIIGTEAQVDVVTSALPSGAATEATLDDIKTAVELIDNIIAGSEAQVDVVTSALPTGAATEANQSTGNAALAAIQTAVETLDNFISGTKGLVTEDNSAAILTAAQAIQAAVEILDNAIAGNEVQVDLVGGTLPDPAAGTAGNLTATTVDTSLDTVIAANASRRGLWVCNPSSVSVFLAAGTHTGAASTLTTSLYMWQLLPRQVFRLGPEDAPGAISGMVASGSVSLAYQEVT